MTVCVLGGLGVPWPISDRGTGFGSVTKAFSYTNNGDVMGLGDKEQDGGLIMELY